MTQTSLKIYSPDFYALGEAVFNGDSFTYMVLNDLGEKFLDNWLFDWQVNGIDNQLIAPTNRNDELAMLLETIPMQSPLFASGFRNWLEDNGYNTLVIPEYAFHVYDLVEALPLNQKEKFILAAKICDLSPSEAAAWANDIGSYLLTDESPASGKSNKSIKPKAGKAEISPKISKAKKAATASPKAKRAGTAKSAKATVKSSTKKAKPTKSAKATTKPTVNKFVIAKKSPSRKRK
ncbi:MAG: hypothetical protein ACOYUZ_06325 [Patescibacteria group bacterium]